MYDDPEGECNLFTAFRNYSEECQIIIKSEPLKESIQELTDSFWYFLIMYISYMYIFYGILKGLDRLDSLLLRTRGR